MEEKGVKEGINWHIGIPVLLWITCVILGILKVILKVTIVENNPICCVEFMDIVNAFNSNTFSTFISVVACMLYQHFSTENVGFQREKTSGLSMKNMPVIIGVSFLYVIIAAFDSALSYIVMTIVFFFVNVIYIVCFFTIFRAKRKTLKER